KARRLDRPTGRGYALWRSQPVGSLPLFFRPFQGGQSRAQLGRFHFSLLRLLPELSQLGLEVGPRGLILLGTCFGCHRALAPGTPCPLHCGGLVPPPFAFGSKLAILLTKLVATLQQGPHQNPVRRLCFVGALQDTLRSNRIGFHARAPCLRNPILTKQKPHFAQTTNAMSRSTRNPPTHAVPTRDGDPSDHGADHCVEPRTIPATREQADVHKASPIGKMAGTAAAACDCRLLCFRHADASPVRRTFSNLPRRTGGGQQSRALRSPLREPSRIEISTA